MELFRLLGTIAINNSEANSEIDKTADHAQKAEGKMSAAFKTAGKAVLAIGTAATAAGTAMVGFANKAAATTDNVDKMSQKIGISRQAYQELDFICSQSGASVDSLQMGLKTLTNQMQSASSGTKSAVAMFDKLGISIYDSTGQLKDQETMMWEAMSALQSMENQTEKAALANDLFGRSGSELMPMLNGAEGSIEAMKQQAHELGLVLSDEAVNAGVAYTDKMDQLKRSFAAVASTVGTMVMPMLTNIGQWIIDKGLPAFQDLCFGIQEAINWWGDSGLSGQLKEFAEAVTPIIKTALELIGNIITKIAIPTVKELIGWFTDMATTAEEKFGWMRDVIESTILVVQEIINAISAAIEGDWDAFWQSIVNIVKGIGSALYNAGRGVFQMLWDGIKSIWTSIENWVSDKVGWITDKLQAVQSALSSIKAAVSEAVSSAAEAVTAAAETQAAKITTSSGSAKSSGTTTSNTAKHAEGGILTKPTIFGYTPSTNTYHLGGEAGAEAIAPIDVLQGYVRSAVADGMKSSGNEKVTGLLEQMVELLQISAANNTRIEINGREFGRMVKEYA